MGASRSFTTNSDSITVSAYADINNIWTGGGTYSAWAYLFSGASNTFRRFVTKGDGSVVNPGWQSATRTESGTIRLGLNHRFGTFTDARWHTNDTLSEDVWINVAVAYNKDSTSNVPVMWINGIQSSVTTGVSPIGTATSDATVNLVLGNGIGTTTNFLEGLLCYVQMWNRILSTAEINEAMWRPGIIRSGLVGFWPVLGSSSPEINLFQGGNTGAVSGAVSSLLGPPITSFH